MNNSGVYITESFLVFTESSPPRYRELCIASCDDYRAAVAIYLDPVAATPCRGAGRVAVRSGRATQRPEHAHDARANEPRRACRAHGLAHPTRGPAVTT